MKIPSLPSLRQIRLRPSQHVKRVSNVSLLERIAKRVGPLPFWLMALYVVNVVLRLPGIYQELPPLTFCDEDLYTFNSYAMYNSKTWTPLAFEAGGANFYPHMLVAHLWTALTGQQFSIDRFILLARILGPVLIGSTMPLFVVSAVAELDRRKISMVAAAVISTLSPLTLGLSRIFYPDHYIIGPAAALILLCIKITKPEAKLITFAAAGALVGILASIKYTGAFMLLFFLAMFVVGTWKGNAVRAATDLRPLLAGIAAVVAFAVLNPFIVANPHLLLDVLQVHHDHYTVGHAGLEADNGRLFYLFMISCFAFGVLGSILLLVGSISLLYRQPRIAIPLIGTLLLFVWIIGGYLMVINRNITMILPIALCIMAIGAADMMDAARNQWPQTRWGLALIALMFLTEPVWRDVMSLRNDFQRDSRAAMQDWIKENIPAGAPIGFSSICNTPYDPSRNPLIHNPQLERQPKCHDYYIRDDWIYQSFGPGNNPLLWPVISEHHYINIGRGFTSPVTRKMMDDYQSNYTPVKTFSDRDYYGPSVTISKRKDSCPKLN
jgi:hypothetical protein